MPNSISRRDFLSSIARGALASWALSPITALRPHTPRSPDLFAGSDASPDTTRLSASVDLGSSAPTEEAIPTRYFYSGFTQTDLDRAVARRDLVFGFPWGPADVHTLGGISQPGNIAIAGDGSAAFTIRRPSVEESVAWEGDSGIQSQIRSGEQNGLVMRLSTAVLSGRVPSDVRSLEISVSLPPGLSSAGPFVGMSGIGWAFWMLVDNERLASTLAGLGVSRAEANALRARYNLDALEEDIAEMSFGEPTVALGYPLWVRLLSNRVMTFMAGRKTMTARNARIDLLHTLFEPVGVGPLPLVNDRTVSGWLASGTIAQDQVLRRPLRARLEIGAPVYDSTRDVMAAPMTFILNGKRLTPTKTQDFAGLESDPNGNTPANLSIWQVKTGAGRWVTLPRQFILNLNASKGHQLTGTSDSVRFSDLVITRSS